MRRAVVVLPLVFPIAAAAQIIYPTAPDWTSSDTPVSTGAALVDLDRDGWLDLVVANGNDMQLQRVAVYYNRGDGTFPATPNWQSADLAYNGHLDVADVNGDGWPDVAVAVLGAGATVDRAAKLYLNQNGTLTSLPAWRSNESANAFGCAFGDVNLDGRPDLAVATGWPYSSPYNRYRNYVYLNVDGQLQAAAGWQSADTRDYTNALWVDADRDGWLDLLFCGVNNDTWLHRNLGGALETAASWRTTDNSGQYAIMMTAGDVTGDTLRDLIVTDNTQLFTGSGRFRQYNGLGGGYFSPTPNWFYYNSNHRYGSAVALADLDGDGRLDLLTGAWWSRTRLFLNGPGGFGSTPYWMSTPSTVVEKLALGDINKDGLRTVGETFAAAPGQPRLCYLAHQPVQQVVQVRRGGVALPPSQFTFSREHGWVSTGSGFGDVEVAYTVSSRLDLAVTNWDNNIGNHVYIHRLARYGDANCDGRVNAFDIDPFVLLLTDRPAYDAQWPDCDADTFCDMNGDGVINVFDIDGFVAAITP